MVTRDFFSWINAWVVSQSVAIWAICWHIHCSWEPKQLLAEQLAGRPRIQRSEIVRKCVSRIIISLIIFTVMIITYHYYFFNWLRTVSQWKHDPNPLSQTKTLIKLIGCLHLGACIKTSSRSQNGGWKRTLKAPRFEDLLRPFLRGIQSSYIP